MHKLLERQLSLLECRELMDLVSSDDSAVDAIMRVGVLDRLPASLAAASGACRMSSPKPKLLLVDDEPLLLEALSRAGSAAAFELRTATSGALGLEILSREPDVAIVMSDMRMPLMNGTTFLAKARTIAPDVVRVLLTGQPQMEDVVAAINEGSIFRLLRKPCSQAVMRATLADAAEQHRLIIAKRGLLEQTLRGAVKAICYTLALANRRVLAWRRRVKRVASSIAAKVGGAELWQMRREAA